MMNISEFYVIRFRKAQKKMGQKLVKGSQQNEKIVACIIRFLRTNFNSVATFFALLMYFRKKFAFCSEFRVNWVDANTFDSATFVLLGIKHRLREFIFCGIICWKLRENLLPVETFTDYPFKKLIYLTML